MARPPLLALDTVYTRDQCEEDACAAGLEADALFHEVRVRPSDPVGEARRRFRVLCDSRHG